MTTKKQRQLKAAPKQCACGKPLPKHLRVRGKLYCNGDVCMVMHITR